MWIGFIGLTWCYAAEDCAFVTWLMAYPRAISLRSGMRLR